MKKNLLKTLLETNKDAWKVAEQFPKEYPNSARTSIEYIDSVRDILGGSDPMTKKMLLAGGVGATGLVGIGAYLAHKASKNKDHERR